MPKIFLANQTDLITTTATAVAALPVAAGNQANGYPILNADKDVPRENLPPPITPFVTATPLVAGQVVNYNGVVYQAKTDLAAGAVATTATLTDTSKFDAIIGGTAAVVMGASTAVVGATVGSTPASPINSMNKVLHADAQWKTPEAKVIPWVITKQYEAGTIVSNNVDHYICNADVPANTAFAVGIAGATWRLVPRDLRIVDFTNQLSNFNIAAYEKNYVTLNQTTGGVTGSLLQPTNSAINNTITILNKGTVAVSVLGYTGADAVIIAPKTSTDFTWNATDSKFYPASGGSGLTVLAQANMTADGNITPLTNNYITFNQTTSSIKATLLAPPTTTAPTIITAANIGTTEITILSKAGGASIKLAPKTTMDLSWGVAAAEWLPTGGGSGAANNLANTYTAVMSSPAIGTNTNISMGTGVGVATTGNLVATSVGVTLLAGRTYVLSGVITFLASTAGGNVTAAFYNVTTSQWCTAYGSTRSSAAGVAGTNAAWTGSVVYTPPSDSVITLRVSAPQLITSGTDATLTAVEVFSNNITVNGVQAEYGEASLVNFTDTNTAFTISGSGWVHVDLQAVRGYGSFTIPSAGVWEVDYSITAAPSSQALGFYVKENAGGAIIPNSGTGYKATAQGAVQQTASFRVTVSGPTTYRLWLAGYAGDSITIHNYPSSTSGTFVSPARVQWKKVSGFLPVSASGVMVGATSSTAGSSGVVPAPVAGEQAEFLRGNGTWAYVGGDVVHAALKSTNRAFGASSTVTLDVASLSANTSGISSGGSNLAFSQAGRYRVEFKGAVCHTAANTSQLVLTTIPSNGLTVESGTFYNLGDNLNQAGSNISNMHIYNKSSVSNGTADQFFNVFYLTTPAGGILSINYFTQLASTVSSPVYGAIVAVAITRIG